MFGNAGSSVRGWVKWVKVALSQKGVWDTASTTSALVVRGCGVRNTGKIVYTFTAFPLSSATVLAYWHDLLFLSNWHTLLVSLFIRCKSELHVCLCPDVFRYRSRRHSYGYYAEHHECVRKSTPVTEAPSTEAPMSGDGATTTDAPRSFVINTVEPMQPSEPPPEKKKKKNNKRKGKGRRDG